MNIKAFNEKIKTTNNSVVEPVQELSKEQQQLLDRLTNVEDYIAQRKKHKEDKQKKREAEAEALAKTNAEAEAREKMKQELELQQKTNGNLFFQYYQKRK